MSFYRVHRQIAAWLAMWAMVLGALAPTVAQAMVAAAEKGQWIEVCSASGMVWLKADGSDVQVETAPDQSQSMADMGKHCPWCGFHAPAAGLPPAVASAPWLGPVVQPVPELSLVALSDQSFHSGQARAPPPAS